jgi:hypothetical protein
VEGCDGRHRNFIECSNSERLFPFFDISPGRRVVGRLNTPNVEAIIPMGWCLTLFQVFMSLE